MTHGKFIREIEKKSHIEKCFLCRKSLLFGRKDREHPNYNSGEHVIPNQIIKKFQWNQTEKHKPFIELRNGMKPNNDLLGESYSEMKIPACKDCNNSKFNKVYDSLVTRLLNIKYSEIDDQNFELKQEIFYWAAFVYYKIYYLKELNSARSRKTKVLDVSHLKSIYLLNLARLGLINISTRLSSPGSVQIFKCQEARKFKKANFDLVDKSYGAVIACRIGKIGFIVSLYDHGHLDSICDNNPLWLMIKNEKLNPLQFRNAIGIADYHVRSLSRMPNFLTTKKRQLLEIDYLPPSMVRQHPFSQENLCFVLSEYLTDPQGTFNFLSDEHNRFRKMKFHDGFVNIKQTKLLKSKP